MLSTGSFKNKIKENNKLSILLRGIRSFFTNTSGNPFYFFHSLGWLIGSFLQRRRYLELGNGRKISLPVFNSITHMRWYNYFEKDKEVRRYIEEKLSDDGIFFDIGANIGVFSIYAACIKNQVRVFSFEPEYSNLHLLKENIVYNNLENKVFPYSFAFSDKEGFSALHLQDVKPGTACHSESPDKETVVTETGYEVKWSEGIMTTTIDRFCAANNIYPEVVKIDTDGNEVKILKGASSVIKNQSLRAIILEIPFTEAEHLECEEILMSSGFKRMKNKSEEINELWFR